MVVKRKCFSYRVAVGLLAAGVVAVAGCGNHGKSATVTADKLAGTWSGKEAERLEISSDGSFKAANLKIDSNVLPECVGRLSAGSWNFYVDDGDTSITSASANQGNSFALDFDMSTVKDGAECSVDMDVRTFGNTLKLCVTEDPGSVCESGNYLERTE